MKPYVTSESIESKTNEWLEYVSSYNRRLTLEKGKAALIVIDMQKYFTEKESGAYTCGAEAIIPNLQKLITAFRKAGRPVIYTKHVHHPDKIDAGIMGWWWEGMCVEGSPESEIHEDLKPTPNEKVILKHRYSAFYNTDLETVLRCLKIEDLVVTGTMTNMCCESTARDAYHRDLRVFFPADGTGAMNEEMHNATLLNLSFGFASITTVDRIIKELNL